MTLDEQDIVDNIPMFDLLQNISARLFSLYEENRRLKKQLIWHDLRKNPEDLPEESIPVLALFSDGSLDECIYIPCEGFKNTVFSTWYDPVAWIEKEKILPKM